ncbi:MAG: phosphopentomutase, partial [Lachnospiraceae bacterium]|nr:phosphopentomutase [Lachnospiraceae bacterium]
AKALTVFDRKLPEIMSLMKEDDLLILTADHGCDPGYTATTDHTREHVPLLIYGKKLEPRNIHTRKTYADIARTVVAYLGVKEDVLEGTELL